MLLEFFKARYWLMYAMTALIALCSFGKATDMNLVAAPYLVLVSILVILTCRARSLPRTLKPLAWLIPITLLASINYLDFNDQTTPYIEYLCNSVSMLFVAIAFYTFMIRYPDGQKVIYLLFAALFVTGVYRYFRSEDMRIIANYTQQQNNAFYYVLMPLPALFLSKNNVLKIAALVITAIICFMSLKRSAIIVISLISIVYLWYNVLKSRNKFWSILIFMTGVAIGFYAVDKSMIFERYEKMIIRFDKLEEDGGSGRADILARFWENDIEDLTRFPEIIMGKGFGATNNKYPELAALHNDWAEIFYSFGVFGLIILIWFFTRLFKNTRYLIKTKSALRVSYITAVILFVFYSFAGGNFFFINTSLVLFAYIGVAETLMKNNKESI